ncbi:disulfide reductase, partial [Archaeoglobales archaeon]
QKAKDLVAAAVAKARLLEPLELRKVAVTPAALVIGGGVAGIQTALDIANSGYKVHLIEREPFLGGKFILLDRTFPTFDCENCDSLECEMCSFIPKMIEVYNHPLIEIHTLAELKELEGYVGNFKAKIVKKPRFVNNRCVGCGKCIEVCPIEVDDEYNFGRSKRKAIYTIPAHFTIPYAYVIDENCNKCGECVDVCKFNAIALEMKEEEITLNVGAIVVATGFELYKPKPNYGYECDEVITTLELERLSSPFGPTNGRIVVNGKEPKKVVFVHCVGSRDEENERCSSVCCMIAVKQAYMLKNKIPDVEVVSIYTDMRTYGKGYEDFYNKAKEKGVIFKRRKLEEGVKVEKRNGRVVVKAVGEKGLIEEEADLVVLSVGFMPNNDVVELGRKLRITQSGDGFYLEAHLKLRPVDTLTDGIFLAGCCQSPKDIPDTIAQASAAASRVCSLLSKYEIETEAFTAFVVEDYCRGCGLCLEVCPYGAISLVSKDEVQVASINEVLCKGCGTCNVTCPTRAIVQKGFTKEQITSMIEAIGGD